MKVVQTCFRAGAFLKNLLPVSFSNTIFRCHQMFDSKKKTTLWPLFMDEVQLPQG